MNDLDALLATTEPEPVTSVSTATPRRCKRHQWGWTEWMEPDSRVVAMVEWCVRCHRHRDIARSRRGKSSRRLGNDQERRAEKRYGWEKIGERGEKTDLRGRMFKVQQKASRRPTPALFRDVFAGLDATRDGRVPLLLMSYVRAGVGTEDFIVVRGSDWLELHGRDTIEETAA